MSYVLPAIAGQISVDELNRINAVFAKAFRCLLTSIVSSTADMVDNADKKIYSTLPSTPPMAYTTCFHEQKIFMVDVYTLKDMVEYYLWPKPNGIRVASSSGVYIAMLSSS